MKKHVVWLSTMAVTLALSAAPASGQQAQEAGVIVGEVVDASERPIAGANATVTGTARGSTTDADGRFRITGISPGERIVRTQRIGFQAMTQEVMVVAGETANVRISLGPSAIDLDEIVVTGRAGRSDRRAQGAVISSVNAADITEKAPVSTMADLLQGRTPSVSLTQSSGTTGTAQRIRIRGGASINLNNDPLIYIDGVRADSRSDANHFTGGQVMSRLNDLNPNDVESIEIVKGPAAATLYGAEASVGVIQIITKRGRPGQPFTQNLSFEYKQNRKRFSPPDNVARCTEGDTQNADRTLCFEQEPGTVARDNPLNRTSPFRNGDNYVLRWSGRGGGENFGYFISFSGESEEGILPDNDLDRYSGRINVEWAPTERLRIDSRLGLNRTRVNLPDNDNNINGWLGSLIGSPRTVGDAQDGFFGSNRGPEAISSIETIDATIRTTPSVQATYTPFDWLNNRLTVGVDISRRETRKFWPRNDLGMFGSDEQNSGRIEQARDNREEITVDYLSSADFQPWARIGLGFAAGANLITTRRNTTWAEGVGLATNDARSVGAAAQTEADETFFEKRELGVFGQVQGALDDRLFLTVATRVDWNSGFGDRTDGFFSPKAEVSYVISEEPFWRNTFRDIVSNFRIRGAWGTTGRSPNAVDPIIRFEAAPNAITSVDVEPGFVPLNPGNRELRPERAREWEFGVDAGFLNERVGVEATYFHKKTTDALLNRPTPLSLGFDTGDDGEQVVNIGDLLNRGFELALDALVLDLPDVTLDARLGFNTLTQRVTDMGDIEPFGTGLRVEEGYQPFARFTHRIRETSTSDERCPRDSDGNTIPCAIVSNTEEFIGNNTPEFEGTASSTLTLFGNLRVYAQFDWMDRFSILNNTAQFRDRQTGNSELAVLRDELPLDEELRRFGPFVTEDGDVLGFADVNEAYIERGDFLKLREVSVSYALPQLWAQSFGASGARLTLAGRNLKTWTNYSGTDPEVLQGNTNFSRTDFLTIPPVRRWVARVDLTF